MRILPYLNRLLANGVVVYPPSNMRLLYGACVGSLRGARGVRGRHWRESQYQAWVYFCAQMIRSKPRSVGDVGEREEQVLLQPMSSSRPWVASIWTQRYLAKSPQSSLSPSPRLLLDAVRGGYFGAPHGRVNEGEPVTRLTNDSPRSPPNGPASCAKVWYL
jgi:hypothetical protein